MKNERKFKDKLITFIVALCLCVGGLYPTALANENLETVTINDDGNIGTYLSDTNDPIKLLNDNGITLDKGDKLDISHFETENTIIINRVKDIYVNDMHNITLHTVYSTTIQDILQEIGVNATEYIILNQADCVVEDGLVIEIAKIYDINVKIDGKERKIKGYYGETLTELLNSEGILTLENDYVSLNLNKKITQTLDLEIKRGKISKQTDTVSIPYETELKYNSSIPAGQKKITQKGINGEKTVTKQVLSYYDVENAEETVLSEKVTKAPVNEIIEIGTKVSNSKENYNGISVGDVINGNKTHYCACAKCGTGTGGTASGMKVHNGMDNPYIIACNWLPMGAVVDIDGVIYTVADRGGSGLSTVGRVDIFTPEGHSACYQKGTGPCTITVLSL